MNEAHSKIRALIVDDEPPARDLIGALLREESDVEVVGKCSNGQEAVLAIRRLLPDLVFLDVQMPGIDGFGVLNRLDASRLPLIVFVTAYNQHAVRAFEAHALDYILKPFEYERLREALRRARAQLNQGPRTEHNARLIALLEELQSKERWQRIAVREPGRTLFLKPQDIDWVEAEGNYMRLHAGRKSYLLRETMNEIATRLGTDKFLRVSRSTLVNIERVKEWQPLFHGDSILILEDATRLTVSRVYRENLDRLMGGGELQPKR
jgi:two-component system LytT family response regulator